MLTPSCPLAGHAPSFLRPPVTAPGAEYRPASTCAVVCGFTFACGFLFAYPGHPDAVPLLESGVCTKNRVLSPTGGTTGSRYVPTSEDV